MWTKKDFLDFVGAEEGTYRVYLDTAKGSDVAGVLASIGIPDGIKGAFQAAAANTDEGSAFLADFEAEHRVDAAEFVAKCVENMNKFRTVEGPKLN